jgi:hypothetical protein
MTKAVCVILGLAFLALGILGITGLVSMLKSDPVFVNIGEIVLGGLGLLVGIYAQQSRKYEQQSKEFSRQSKDAANRQSQENEQLKKQLEQQRQENERQRKHDN